VPSTTFDTGSKHLGNEPGPSVPQQGHQTVGSVTEQRVEATPPLTQGMENIQGSFEPPPEDCSGMVNHTQSRAQVLESAIMQIADNSDTHASDNANHLHKLKQKIIQPLHPSTEPPYTQQTS
jgi:hypothetical protein